jgi:drug/metabolite transporter (DMT)-like permease
MLTTRGRRGATGLLVATAFSWGLGIVLTKVTLEQLAPLDLLLVELGVGTAAVWLALLARGGPRGLSRWRAFVGLGVLEPGLAFAAGDFGLNLTGATDGALLLASESLFAITLAWFALGERPGQRAAIAVAVGFAGSILIGIAPSAAHASVLGDALVLGGAAVAAIYSVAARSVAGHEDADPLTVTGVQLLAALILCIPLTAAATAGGHSDFGNADAGHLVAAAATGLFTSAIPFLLYNAAIRDIEVTAAALILNLIPVFGVVLSVAVIGEHPGPVQLAGGALVLGAAVAAERVTRPGSVPVG